MQEIHGQKVGWVTDQDSVRLLAVEACGPLASILTREDTLAFIIPVVQKFAQVMKGLISANQRVGALCITCVTSSWGLDMYVQGKRHVNDTGPLAREARASFANEFEVKVEAMHCQHVTANEFEVKVEAMHCQHVTAVLGVLLAGLLKCVGCACPQINSNWIRCHGMACIWQTGEVSCSG